MHFESFLLVNLAVFATAAPITADEDAMRMDMEVSQLANGMPPRHVSNRRASDIDAGDDTDAMPPTRETTVRDISGKPTRPLRGFNHYINYGAYYTSYGNYKGDVENVVKKVEAEAAGGEVWSEGVHVGCEERRDYDRDSHQTQLSPHIIL
ncbi:hypothetical protein K458DRAFT_410624 [Lentithecium fluviatile CBS 122367]|uniref:Uncharacterized protein n=1 Tax=Lentithecium fluviatile CBS 122367 TaxID=1168545 RepID=A0A6G1IDR7_9PLEO|nr:hypothetical protein K458DRAFT_410624 [Lentithecium fluviatile CBS 122367]